MNRLYVFATVFALAVVGAGFWWMKQPPGAHRHMMNPGMHGADAAALAKPADETIVPKLSSRAVQGQIAFEQNCAVCHGKKGSGSDSGPPLVHKIYEPSHHADFSFTRAVGQGVRSHHWRFGDMPPIEGVTDKQIEWIVSYVREIQRANGIN